jgi:hypothetical protein
MHLPRWISQITNPILIISINSFHEWDEYEQAMTHWDESRDGAARGQHAVMSQALSLTQVLKCWRCCKLSNDTCVCVCVCPTPRLPLVPQYLYQPLHPKGVKSANNKLKVLRMHEVCKPEKMQHSTHMPSQYDIMVFWKHLNSLRPHIGRSSYCAHFAPELPSCWFSWTFAIMRKVTPWCA